MLVGLTEMEAVGAGGGGGGGGGGVTFFLQAQSIMKAPKTMTSANHFMYLRVIFCPLTFFQPGAAMFAGTPRLTVLFACAACWKQV
jgi:hypothetical protein